MSTITIKNPYSQRDTAEPSGSTEPKNTTNDQESREQFYRDYRQAVREMRRGDPERFIAYQNDPRIKPCPESLKLPSRTLFQQSPTESEVVAVPALAEAQFSVTSLLSSVREMATVLGKLLS